MEAGRAKRSKTVRQRNEELLTKKFMFINWTQDMTNAVLASATGLITDLTPLLTIIVGIGIGLIVFYAIISAIRGH